MMVPRSSHYEQLAFVDDFDYLKLSDLIVSFVLELFVISVVVVVV
jgi:hypothetical protein